MKAGTCARDRRAIEQLALNVHVKHSDLTSHSADRDATVISSSSAVYTRMQVVAGFC